MTGIRITKRQLSMVSVAIVVSMLTQWLLIPKIQWNNKVNAAGETFPQNYDSASSVNYSTILGGAVDYGVVTTQLDLRSHTETTFAANMFNNYSDNIDVDFVDTTALFIIGGLGTDKKVTFGPTTASSLYIEGPSSVLGGADFTLPLDGTTRGNFTFNDTYGNKPVIPAINENASSNVNRLINRISSPTDGRSLTLSNRCNPSAGYVLNPTGYCDFFTDQNGNILTGEDQYTFANASKLKINLSAPQFHNRVVYINITADMIKFITNAPDNLWITKDPSTVVVLNIEDSVCPDMLDLYGPKLITSGHTFGSGESPRSGYRGADDYGNTYADIQQYYNESIIWNVRTSKSVKLNNMGGVMLFPNASDVEMATGNQTGWVVANCPINMKTEFHFFYQGTSNDSNGQMHFALLKGFTDAYADKTSVNAITSVDVSDGDYTFAIQEVNAFGDTTPYSGGFADTDSVDSRSSSVFDSLQFYTGDDADRASTDHYYILTPTTDEFSFRDYYFRVYESAMSSSVGGVSKSDGYIDIQLRVRVDQAGHFSYLIKYKSYTGGGVLYEDKTNNTGTDTVDGFIIMSGVQFDLGTFYNKVNKSLTITKTITGDYVVPAGGKTYQFYVYTGDGDNKTYYKADGTSNGSTPVAIEVTVPEGLTTASISIPGLPDGTYHVDEVAASAEVAGYDLDSGSHTTTATISTASPIAQANITNDYTKQHNLEVTKVLSGSGASSIDPDAEFEFTIYNGTQYVQADGTLGPDPVTFSVKVGDTFKINVPAGDYQIIEDETVAASYATGNIVFDATASNTTVNVSPSSPSSPVNGELENVYNDESLCILNISKTTQGATYNDNQSNAFNFRVTYVDNGTTYYVHLENGHYVADQYNQNATVSVMPGSSVSITGDFVISGRLFTIEEVNPGGKTENWRFVDGQSHTYSSTTINGATGTSVDVTISGTTNPVNVINYFDGATPSTTGTLVIEKTVNGINGAAGSGPDLSLIDPITFTVSGPDSALIGSIPELSAATVTSGDWVRITNTNTYRYVINVPLTAGDIYTVTESSDGHNSSYSVTTTCTPSDGKVTIVGGDEVAASFINQYTPVICTGSLVIRKTITGADLTQIGTISFDAVGTGSTSGSLTIPDLTTSNVGTTVGTNWIDEGNGLYTFTVSGLEQGATYRVEETADGHNSSYDVTVTPSGKVVNVTIPTDTTADTSINADFANDYSPVAAPTGTLVVTKSITGGATAPSGMDYYVVLTSDGGSVYYDLHGNVVPDAASAVQTIRVTGNSGTITYDGLDLSKTYTVTETNSSGVAINGSTSVPSAISGYDWTSTGSTIVAPASAFDTTTHQATARITNNYESTASPTGTLVVTKSITGGATAPSGTDYYVVLTSDGGSVYYDLHGNVVPDAASAVQTIRVTGNSGTITYDGLDLSKTYTVTETNSSGVAISATNTPSAITGYDWTSTGSTIVAPASAFDTTTHQATATIVNNYAQQSTTVELTVEKVVSGCPSAASRTFGFYLHDETYQYYDENGAEVPQPHAIPFSVNGPAVINLPAGHSYTVEETGANQPYSPVITGYDLQNPTYRNNGVNLPDPGDSATIVVTNTYTQQTGSLEVSKVLTAPSGASITGPFYFYVQDGNNNFLQNDGTFATAANYFSVDTGSAPFTLSGIPVGTYTITEITAPNAANTAYRAGYNLLTTYTGSGVTNVNTLTISKNLTSEAVINNTYTVAGAELTVEKVVSGGPSSAASRAFGFYLHDENNQYYDEDGHPVPAATAIEFSVNTPAVISGLPTGHTYTVVETGSGQPFNPVISGYDLQTTYSDPNGVRLANDGDTATTTVTNAYTQQVTPQIGDLVLHKTVDATFTMPATATFTFYVQGADGLFYDENGLYSTTAVPITVHYGTDVTIYGIPAQTYTVWEDVTGDMHAAPNYTFDANGSTTRTTATVPDGSSDTATITNKYQQNAPTTGTLVVTKVVTGDTSITGPFSFTVTNAAGEYLQAQDTGLFGSTEVTFSVVAGGSVSFTNIPDGVVCTVTETDADSFGPIEGGSTTSGSATIVAGGSVTVALSNIYATPTPTTDPSTPTTAPTESSEPTSSSEPTDTSAPTESSETDSTGGDDGSSGGPLTGSLIINKTISGASLSELGAITFVLTDTSCGATRDVPALTLDNVQCGLWGDAGNGTYYCIVEGLSAGITYTVTESADGQTATYSLNASSSVTSASAAIVANETSSVSLTDVYVPTGSTVPTEPGVESSETTAPGEDGETTEGTTAPVPEVVTVTLSDGTTLNPDCYTVNSDGTITLTAAGRNVLGAGRHQVTITFADGTTITQTLIVDSADRVGATGENDINVFAAIILLTSAALVFSAKKLREEEV